MSIQSVPRELIDKIIGSLTEKKDLVAVSLTSSHFLPSARRSLFSHVDVSCETQDSFRGSITSSLHIAHCIQKLTFRKKNPHQAPTPRPSSVLTIGQVNDLLSILPLLQSLHLHDVLIRREPADLDVGSNSQYALKQLTVTDAVSAGDMIPFLSLFSRIDELTVSRHWSHSTLREHELAGEDLDILLASLNLQVPRNLYVSQLCLETNGATASFYTELLKRTQTSGVLTSFTMNHGDLTSQLTSSSPILDFLQACNASLTHMTLGASDTHKHARNREVVSHDYVSKTMRDKLAALTKLHSLTFRLVYSHRGSAIRSYTLPLFASLLSAFPPTIRKVEFIFRDERQGYPGKVIRGPWYKPSLDIHPLQPVLLRMKSLESVVFGNYKEIPDREKESLLKALPELASRGLISFIQVVQT